MYACSRVFSSWSSTPVKTLRCSRLDRYGGTTSFFGEWDRPALGIFVRWVLAYGCALVYDCLRFSSCSYERRAEHVAILPSALYPYLAAFFHIYDTLQYLTDVMGADRWGDFIQGFVSDIPELSDLGRAFVVHVPLDQYLFVHPCRFALVGESDG